MSENQHLEFDELTASLQRGGAQCGASECHGLLAGLVCGQGLVEPRLWLEALFEEVDPHDALQVETAHDVQALYLDTQARLNSPDLDLQLLVPDDAQPLEARSQGLADWCAGFLAGLGLANVGDGGDLSGEVEELLHDLAEISRLDTSGDDADENEQAAFEEVAEYIRVAALFIHEELQPAPRRATLQ